MTHARGAFVLCALALLLHACGDDSDPASSTPDASVTVADGGAGDAGTALPALRGVIPGVGHPGGTVDVVVVVDNATIDENTPLDFGAGITVDQVTAISSTVVSATLTIDLAATAGDRDVTVGSGSNALVGTAAFTVTHALDLTVSAGTPVQGGLLEVRIDSADDVSLFPWFLLEGGLWIVEEYSKGADYWTGLVAVDPLAPASSPIGAVTTTNTFDPLTHFTAAPLAVGATSAKEVTVTNSLTTLSNQNLDAPLATAVYKLSATGPGLIFYSVRKDTNPGPFQPVVSILPASGSFQDVINTSAPVTGQFIVSPGAHDFYLIVRDRNGNGDSSGDFGFAIQLSLLPATSISEQSTPHATTGTAQSISTLVTVSGELTPSDGQDVYSVTGSLAQDGVTLATDADLELVENCGNGDIVRATDRPYERAVSFPMTVLNTAMTCFYTVRASPGVVGRPTGSYLLSKY